MVSLLWTLTILITFDTDIHAVTNFFPNIKPVVERNSLAHCVARREDGRQVPVLGHT